MRRITVLLALLIVTLSSVLAASAGSRSASAADDPNALLDQLTTKLNAHDGAGAAALFSEDGIFSDLSGTSFAGVGVPAIAAIFSDVHGIVAAADPAFSFTIVSSDVSGNTVTGVANLRNSVSVAAAVERYVQPYTATVSGGKITGLHLTYDESDAQTLTYLQYSASQPGDNSPPSDATTTTMMGNEKASLVLGTLSDGVVSVTIIADGDPGPYGVLQPASIYSGSCAGLGSPVSALAPYVYGNSYTYVSGNLQDWLNGDYAVTIGDSPDNPGVIVSCANIEQGAPPEETIVTGGPDLPNTGTGGSSGFDLSWLIATLALLGVAFAGAGTLAARRRS